jgi:Spy/CpxP family protein refolding chaperone
MKKRLLITMVIVLMAVSAAMAGHHGNRGQGPKPPRTPMSPDTPRGFCDQEMGRHFQGAGRLLHLAGKLELSDEQIATIKDKMEKNGLERIDRQAELKKAKLQLRHLKMNDASESEILAAIDKVGKLQTEMRKQRFMHRSEIHNILTEEQQDKLKKLRNEFRCGDRPGRGHRGLGLGYDFDDDTDFGTYGQEPPTPSEEWED